MSPYETGNVYYVFMKIIIEKNMIITKGLLHNDVYRSRETDKFSAFYQTRIHIIFLRRDLRGFEKFLGEEREMCFSYESFRYQNGE